MLVPFVDRMRPLIDLREQVVSFPPQPVITSDNLTVAIDSVIYFQVTDPRAATYEIQNYILAVEQLTITTLRNVVGSLNLEQALTSRDGINTQLRVVLDEATGPWGIRVARVEIKAIEPPPSIRDAMEQQMRADRAKRAAILTAEGAARVGDPTAEGKRAAQILNAEGQKAAAILAAEADRQSAILRAEGQRAAQYLRGPGRGQGDRDDVQRDPRRRARPGAAGLPVPADAAADRRRATSNKLWIVPSEFSKALEGISRLGGWSGRAEPAPATPAPAARAGGGAGAAAAASAADRHDRLVRHHAGLRGHRRGDRGVDARCASRLAAPRRPLARPVRPPAPIRAPTATRASDRADGRPSSEAGRAPGGERRRQHRVGAGQRAGASVRSTSPAGAAAAQADAAEVARGQRALVHPQVGAARRRSCTARRRARRRAGSGRRRSRGAVGVDDLEHERVRRRRSGGPTARRRHRASAATSSRRDGSGASPGRRPAASCSGSSTGRSCRWIWSTTSMPSR